MTRALLVGIAALLGTLGLAPPARAAPCTTPQWTAPGTAWQATLAAPDGHPVAVLRATDGGTTATGGWRPDEDPRVGQLRVGLVALCGLPAGTATTDEDIPARTVLVTVDPAATGVVGWGRDAHGDAVALAWAPATGGQASLPLADGLRWELAAEGTALPWIGRAQDGDRQATLAPLSPAPRRWSPALRRRALGLLYPVQALLALVALVALGRAARRLGAVPTLLAAGVGVGLLWPVLADPGRVLLWTGGAVADPRDSAALLAQLADALAHGGDVGFRFRYPEGASVLWGGPALLGYLPGLPSAFAGQPIAGHNIGNAVWMAILALSCGALARARGLGPAGVVVAAVAGAASPALVDELDAWSLDRATLAAVPLAVWAIERCARRPGPGGALLVGLAVGGALYAQVYTGLYLALVAPLWVLLRVPGRGAGQRLGWLAAGGLAAALVAAPGLHHLATATAGAAETTDARPLREVVPDVLAPLSPAAATAAVQHSRQARRGRGGLPMATATDRLATALALSIDGRELVSPQRWLPLGRWWWGLAALLVLAAPRRRSRWLAVAEPASLLVLAAGPFLLWDGRWTGLPLPHLLPWLVVPGWEELKNVHRAALMAAPLAGLVPAMLVDGLAPRRRGPALVLGLGAAVAVVGLSHGGRPPAPKLRRLSVEPALAAARGRALVPLPLDRPMPPAVVEAALVHGFSVVGAPPFEADRHGTPPWMDDNALLNRWALASGSSRPQRALGGSAGPALADLRRYGVDGAVLVPAAARPGTLPGLRAALDAVLVPAAAGPGAALWWLPPAQEPPPAP